MDTTIYNNLIESCKGDPELLEFISDQMTSYLDYVNSVVNESIQIPILRQKYMGEPQILQYEIMDLDKTRRTCHEAAIASCVKLNRISESQGLPPFYDGDINDRYQVADFAIDVVRSFYDKNSSRTRELNNDEYMMTQEQRIPYRQTILSGDER